MVRPLLIVAGKGGVGRSTVSAALARRFDEATSAKVLAVDAIADGGLAAALGMEASRSGGGSGATRPLADSGIEVLELDTEASLDEYLKIYTKLPIPPSRLGPIAKIFDYVATAAPGVREILTIGKIAFEVREASWDVVILDAPATGHVVELLDAPANLSRLISVGPLAEQTRWIEAILADPQQTGVLLVTTTEELPVTELLELHERLVTTTAVNVIGIIANRVPPLLGAKAIAEAEALTGPLALAGQVVAERSNEAREGLARLATLGLPIVRVPESEQPVAAMSKAFAKAFGGSPAASASKPASTRSAP